MNYNDFGTGLERYYTDDKGNEMIETYNEINMDEVYRLMDLIKEPNEFKMELKKELKNLKRLKGLKGVTQNENSVFIKIDISVFQECYDGIDDFILSFEIEGDRTANITYINYKRILKAKL